MGPESATVDIDSYTLHGVPRSASPRDTAFHPRIGGSTSPAMAAGSAEPKDTCWHTYPNRDRLSSETYTTDASSDVQFELKALHCGVVRRQVERRTWEKEPQLVGQMKPIGDFPRAKHDIESYAQVAAITG